MVFCLQAVKILLYLARLAEASGDLDNLIWLAKRVIKEANMEVVNNVKLTIRVRLSSDPGLENLSVTVHLI